MGKKFGRVLFLKDYPNFLKDETIARLCEFPQNLMLSIQIVPVPMEAVADMQKRVLAVETDITRWQQKQNANHNFSAEPPYEMQQMRQEMKALLDDLTSRDQRMVLVLVTLVHLADSYAQLNSDTEAITATARGDLCRFNTIHFQQEEGLNTALPYGLREIEAMRTMNTESAAALTPFSVQDVMDRGGSTMAEVPSAGTASFATASCCSTGMAFISAHGQRQESMAREMGADERYSEHGR